MLHRFPRTICAANISEALELVDDMSFDQDLALDCDASQLTFVDPAGLCLLAYASHFATQNGRTVNIQGLSKGLNTYLQRMDVFAECNVEGLRPVQRVRHDRGVLLEVARVHDHGSVDATAARLTRAMLGNLPEAKADPDGMRAAAGDYQQRALTYVLTELLENGLTHARREGFGSATTWASCQYYPNRGVIRASVVDNGCGYLRSLRPQYGQQLDPGDHAGAIDLAFRPRISANRNVGLAGGDVINAGMGLTISRDIVHAAQGHMHVGSGDRLVTMMPGRVTAQQITTWNGVLLSVEMGRDALRAVRIEDVVRRYNDRPDRDIRYID